MFKTGDTVRSVAANIVGVVVEMDGDTVYLEQSNGVEVDFQASKLVLESEFQAKHDTSVRGDAGTHQNDAIYAAVMDNIYPAVAGLGQRLHAAVKPVPGVVPKSWESLSALQKLNVISEATDVPMKMWLDSSQVGAKPSLAELQLTVLGDAGQKA
jgi:hypothetical protein